VARQLALLVEDLPIAAVKVGMLANAEVARAVVEGVGRLARASVPVVLDPVLRATAGASLLDGNAWEALAPLMALATVVTPNAEEARRLSGIAIEGEAGQREAARTMRFSGARAVLVKGGHLDGEEVVDLLVDDADEPLVLRAPRRPAPTPHGTGCALATAIACGLAEGMGLREAVADAHRRVGERIAGARAVGKGRPFLRSPARP
jgi:hydroxymethylpyrimidine/phosphomethylpyrimidine kinase